MSLLNEMETNKKQYYVSGPYFLAQLSFYNYFLTISCHIYSYKRNFNYIYVPIDAEVGHKTKTFH